MTQKPEIMISGAGIGGLTAALALIQRGFAVQIFEQALELRELGAGLQLGPDGSRILQALDLEGPMSEVICEAAEKEVRLWSDGTRRKLFDLGEDSLKRFGAPYWFVHRGDFHRVLRDAVEARAPGAIRTGKKGVRVTETPQQVTLHFEDGSAASADVLIGADGVHSAVRDHLFTTPRPHFVGIVAWRGLAQMTDLPEDLRDPVGANWVGPGGHVITYPLRRGEILNFVGLVERDDWTVEGWSIPGDRAECHADFENWHPQIHRIIDTIDQPFKWALAGRDPLTRWSRGPISLLGDAAHPTLPFLAHGAIMALEDAYVLARCLDDTPETPERALRRYEQARIARTTRIVNASAANTQRFHNPILADPIAALNYLDTEWAPEKVRARYDWLFEYDATTVPIAA